MKANELIQDYQVTETLHEGEHTRIYRAIRTSDKKSFILKTSSHEYPSSAQMARLVKEYDLLEKLDIDGVIHTEERLNIKNRPILVFRDTNSISLADHFAEERPTIGNFLKIAIELTTIIRAVHGKRVIHKDINPDNIIINPETGAISLIDFGISTQLYAERATAHNPNWLEGTLSCMAPEQTGRMNRSVDYRADFYSLGMTFYWLLCGEFPFKSNDAMELVYSHIARNVEPPSEKFPSVPGMLSAIILKLTSKDPEDRYQSSAGIKIDLQKCLDAVEAGKDIPPFELARHDVSSRFKIPQRLYGREEEINQLMDNYREVEKGASRLMLISGFSGIGKTALINEIHKPTVRQKGYFISGKFDQFKTNIPFNGFALAFADLTEYLLSEPQEKLEAIKAELLKSLARNASVLIELVPEMEQIIGKQPEVQDLNPLEAENRFFFTLREFIQVFARKEHPLTIFVDDLQWTDDSSLRLIRELVVKKIPYLFLIGAYRDNEVSETHPLSLMLDDIRKGNDISEIQLEALNEEDVNHLVADSFNTNRKATSDISAVVHRLTAGNPFYINELLKTLYSNGLIVHDMDQHKWLYDLDKIAELEISGNVVEYMARRISELDDQCLNLLEIGACMGNTFKLETLARISGNSASETAALLWPAIEEELIIPLSENYRLIVDNEDFGLKYKFHHDRIQHTVYLRNDEERRKEIHYKIGRILLEKEKHAPGDGDIIEIVQQLNKGEELIRDRDELDELAKLNLAAGKRARNAVAYKDAYEYFKNGIALLPNDPWRNQHDLTFDLYAGLAENAYQLQDYKEAEDSIELLLKNARSKMEKVKIYAMRLRQYTVMGKSLEAIREGITGLAVLGHKLPEKPGTFTVLAEVIKAKWNLGRKKAADLLDGPVLEDPEMRAAARIYSEIGPSAYVMGNDNLYGLTQLRIVNMSLKYGNCPESSFAYTAFGTVLSEAFGDLNGQQEFGKLAIDLNNKLGDIEYRCRVIAAYGVLIHHFNYHWVYFGEYLKTGIEAGYLSGDLFFLANCAANTAVWNPNLPLAESERLQLRHLKIVEETGFVDSIVQCKVQILFTRGLMGKLNNNLHMADDQFDEDVLVPKAAQKSTVGIYTAIKTELFYHFGEFEKAYELMLETDKYVKSMTSLITLSRHSFYSFLICSGYLTYGKNPPVGKLKKRMKAELRKQTKWARYNAVNFEHKKLLLQAELARVRGDHIKASRLYEKAIETADEHEWLSEEAVSNELMGRYLVSRGMEKAASGYLKEAYYLYEKWGAKGKMDYLDKTYPELKRNLNQPGTGTSSYDQRMTVHGSVKGVESHELIDVATIVKSSQAISGEIELESLLSKMMEIIRMNAGAENGVLLLQNNNELVIQAIAHGDKITTMQNIRVADSTDIPGSVINFVLHGKEALVLNDAAREGKFTTDPYIGKNNVKSVLCCPIVLLNKLYGVIYLENNISTGAFTEDRLRILTLLSSQMAISIQNAQVYANLEAQVEDRTRELSREKQKSDDLLNNILPEGVAKELKATGKAEAKLFENVSVLLTDFIDFTEISAALTPTDLVKEINEYFTEFDAIIERNGLEKIKTIGDAYLAVCGIPWETDDHAAKAVHAALEIRDFVESRNREGGMFNIRIGINSGPVVAGIVGVKKFAYDIWSDTVNTASRMETAGKSGKVNISAHTYGLIQGDKSFAFESRGKVEVKGKGELDMYFVESSAKEKAASAA